MKTQLESPKGKSRGRWYGARPERPQADEASRPSTQPFTGTSADKPLSRIPKKAPGLDLRAQYRITLQLGLALSLLGLIGLVHAPLSFDDSFEFTVDAQEIVQMEEIQQTKQIEQPPPPPRPPVPVEVPNDAILDADVELDLDAALDIDAPLAVMPPPPPAMEAPEEKTEEEDEAEIFVVVEQMPELIGGVEGIAAQLRYPEVALRAGVEGRVIVQFVIDQEGRPSDFEIIRGQGAGLDEEAIRVLQLARFKPGMQRGKAVKVRMTMPITFRLRDAKRP